MTAEAIAEAAVEAVYGALVLEALEEWAGASADNPLDVSKDARGRGLECKDCFEEFYRGFGVEPWLSGAGRCGRAGQSWGTSRERRWRRRRRRCGGARVLLPMGFRSLS